MGRSPNSNYPITQLPDYPIRDAGRRRPRQGVRRAADAAVCSSTCGRTGGRCCFALVAIVAGGCADLAQPYIIKTAIDRYIAAGSIAGLDWLAVIFLAVLIVGFAAEYVQTWTMQLTGQRIMFDLRMAVYGHLQRLDLRFYDRNPVGRLMTRVTSDVDVLNDLFTSGVVTAFGDVFKLVGIMVIMLGMNWQLALVAFAVLPLIVLVTQWFRRNVRESYRVVRGWIARINAFCRKTSPAWPRCSCSGGSSSTSRGSTRSTGSTATRTSTRSSTTPCSTRRSRRSARWPRR
jgi:hypothetical protein